MIGMNAIFIIASLVTIIANKGGYRPAYSISSFIESPILSFKHELRLLIRCLRNFCIWWNGLGGVTDSMKNPAKTFPRGLVALAVTY